MPGASPRALANTLIHPLARMLPNLRFQQQVYRFGEKSPPVGSMMGHTPHWAITELSLAALATQQVRMNLQPDFHWLAVTASSSVTVTFPITAIARATTAVPFTLTVANNLQVGEIIRLSGLTTEPDLNGVTRLVVATTGQVTTTAGALATATTVQLNSTSTNTQPASTPETGLVTVVRPAPTGFRAQIYDTAKALRMADRGVQFANLGGGSNAILWLRDPYHFDLPDPQVLLVVQNLENLQNQIQVALYGQVLRFNQVAGTN